MRRRKAKPSFARAMAKPLFAMLLLGLLWVAVQLDLHNDVSRALIAPLAPDHVERP